MKDDYEMLKLRVLLYFQKNEPKSCSVVKIARTLDITKQRVSRVLIEFEKDGLVNRIDQRHPVLTPYGRERADLYAERIRVSLNHLLSEGVKLEYAEQDAYHWALYNTDETMKVIKSAEATYRAKYELRDRKNFDGNTLCKKLGDGIYPFNFVIYREHIKNGSNLSMANSGFEHPCHLIIRNGVGKVSLHSIGMKAMSPITKHEMNGKVDNLQYFYNGIFTQAEINSDIIAFPAAALNFVNIGEGINQVLHGSVCLKIKCSVSEIHMPESVAIFNMIL